MQITLNISEEVYQRYEWLAQLTGRSFDDVLNDSLIYPLPSLNPAVYKPVEILSDAEVLALAELQMSEEQGERLGELQYKQREGLLNETESPELWALMQVYQIGLLRKAQGLREAVERGLMKRLEE